MNTIPTVNAELKYGARPTTIGFFAVLSAVGAVALLAGLALQPARTWIDLFLISNYLVGLALGGLLLVALHYVTKARWSLPLRRLNEAMTGVLPLGVIGLLAVLIAFPSLYPWSAGGEGASSPLKEAWLSRPFFLARTAIYVALWLVFAFAIVRTSRRQDRSEGPTPTLTNTRLSAFFLVVFGVTCWLASYDWVMSLDPKWASTIFGVYYFAGLFLSALAALVLLVVFLRRSTPLGAVIGKDQLHDLGTLLFAFSSFWMYAWFCQYLLIWYVNNPEETAYFRTRWEGNWPLIGLVDIALNWGIPFVVLLFRFAKRNSLILGAVACAVLVGRWLDLGFMILPSQRLSSPLPGYLEIGLVLGSCGVFALAVLRGLGRAPLVPFHDPVET